MPVYYVEQLLENIGYDATGRQKNGSEVQQCINFMTQAVTWEPNS